jgi:peptide/nickel transport system ATP-binding protein
VSDALLSGRDLVVRYPVPRGLIGRDEVHAVRGVSLDIRPGESVGLVGESGCGKSTLGRVLAGLQQPTAGTLLHRGEDVSRAAPGRLGREVAMVFQDPASSLNPRWRVDRIVRDPLDVHEVGDEASRAGRVAELLDLVGLPASSARRLPRQLSGGQRQRVAIARALALDPCVLVADEPTSSLDVSVKAKILGLLAELRERLGLAMVFISHDIGAVRYVADRIAVMYLGRIVEEGPAERVWGTPGHPYTEALFSAVPSLGGRRRERVVLRGSVPSARRPPPGCPFFSRCWLGDAECVKGFPEPRGDERVVFCVRPLREP